MYKHRYFISYSWMVGTTFGYGSCTANCSEKIDAENGWDTLIDIKEKIENDLMAKKEVENIQVVILNYIYMGKITKVEEDKEEK